MKRLNTIKALALAASVAGLTAATSFSAEAGCVLAGGEATMVTSDLAKFMAGAALKNSMASHGWTARGAVKMTCKDQFPTTYCIARQRACS